MRKVDFRDDIESYILTHIAAPVNKNSKKAVNNLVFINNFKNPQINNEYNQAVTD